MSIDREKEGLETDIINTFPTRSYGNNVPGPYSTDTISIQYAYGVCRIRARQ